MDTKTKQPTNTIKKTVASIDHAQTKDLGDGVVEVIVSTNNLDRHGEILDIKGLDLSKYNGIVLLNHDYGSLPIGKSVMLKKKTVDGVQQLISQTKFAVDQYDLAATVYKLVRDGFMSDVSIGFIAKDYEVNENGDFVWTKSEMIEYSHVTVGANADAKVTAKALEKIGVSEDEFQTEIKDAFAKSAEMQAKSFEELLGDPKGADQLLAGAKALKEAATALEATLSARPVAESKSNDQETARTRRVKLVTARKQAQAADRLVESLISGLKESIK
jgi:HK97 family phage prohead protease